MGTGAGTKLDSWSASHGTEVYLCGVGARTPLGLDAASTAAAVRAAIFATGEHPFFLDGSRKPVQMACDAELPASLAAGTDIAERMTSMLRTAVGEALGSAWSDWRHEPFACYIGFPEPRPGLLPDVAGSVVWNLSDALGIEPRRVQLLQRGHSAGLMAMQYVAGLISSGKTEIGIVASVDSYHSRGTLDWLDSIGALSSKRNRNGFIPGEAASVCILASPAAASRYCLPALAGITAAATSMEPHAIRGEANCIGEGLSAVLKDVIATLRRRRERITTTYCDLNGERYRSEEFLYTILRTQDGFVNAHDYQSPADCFGDVGAASGPLYSSLAVASKLGGYAKGTTLLLWAGSESGFRTAVTLTLG